MTIPWLMNCGHREDGWCLECVKELGEKYDREHQGRVAAEGENVQLRRLIDRGTPISEYERRQSERAGEAESRAADLERAHADCRKMLEGEHDAHMECHARAEKAEGDARRYRWLRDGGDPEIAYVAYAGAMREAAARVCDNLNELLTAKTVGFSEAVHACILLAEQIRALPVGKAEARSTVEWPEVAPDHVIWAMCQHCELAPEVCQRCPAVGAASQGPAMRMCRGIAEEIYEAGRAAMRSHD